MTPPAGLPALAPARADVPVMAEAYVPAAAVAELLGVDDATIRRRCYADTYDHRYAPLPRGGTRLEIALASLPEDVQVKALQRLQPEPDTGRPDALPAQITTQYEAASAARKAVADRRFKVLTMGWQYFALHPDLPRTAALDRFLAELGQTETQSSAAPAPAADGDDAGPAPRGLTRRARRSHPVRRAVRAVVCSSRSTFYAWETAYRTDSMDGLLPADETGGRPSSVNDWHKKLFLSIWGSHQKPKISVAHRALGILCEQLDPQQTHGPVPSIHAIRYLEASLTEQERSLLRDGPKAIRAKLLSYMERDWEGVLPLEWFVLDFTPLDVLALDDEGHLMRPYLCTLEDMGTRRVCVTVCKAPNQIVVLWTIAKAILTWGIPKNIYVDNGKEFKSAVITGGRRGKPTTIRLEVDEDRVRSLCDKFHITVHFARKENAQAKPVERFHLTLEQNAATIFEAFTGNSPSAKPEELKDIIKAGRLSTARDVERVVTGWIEGEYHAKMRHHGRGMGGMTPNEAWEERIGLVERVTTTIEQLAYFLLPSTTPCTVRRNQVRIFKRNYEAAPNTPDCLFGLYGERLIPLYNPDDISKVFLTHADGRAVGWVICKALAPVGASEETYRRFNAKQRRLREALRAHHMELVDARIEPDRLLAEARKDAALRAGRPALGALPPAAPPAGESGKVVRMLPVSRQDREAAALAAAPPQIPAPPPAAADWAEDYVDRPAPAAPPPAEDWASDYIQEGPQ